MKYRFLVAFLLGLAGAAWADEVKLRNGGLLKGSTWEENGKVVVDTGLGTVTLPADQVVAILPGPFRECGDPVPCPASSPAILILQAAKPADAPAPPRKVLPRRSRPQPEISPGYTTLGIPPMNPRRGSQNHGGYGASVLMGIPTPVRGLFVSY